MTEILILCTDWAENYWEINKKAPYPKMSIEPIKHLKRASSIPGIGVYVKAKKADLRSQPPCLLEIRSIEENEKGEPLFNLHFIQKMEGISSAQLIDEIGRPGFFFSLSQEKVLDALSKFGIRPPSEWETLLSEKPTLPWQDLIGKHFLSILEPISTNVYEDRVAETFKALGFEVEQMGYKREGEYPDGIIYSRDFSIVYDCKNRPDYFLDARDKRAMVKYIQDAKRRIKEKRGIEKIYFALVAHSYNQLIKNLSDIEKETSTKGILLTSEALLYLLFKKLFLGHSFLLADFEGLVSGQIITRESIDKVYSG